MKQIFIRARILLCILSFSVITSEVKAQSYNGINFDGVNDYISLPSSNTLPVGNSDYTIEAWIKTTAMGAYGIIGWGPYWGNNQVNAFRISDQGLDNYWWGNDINITTANILNTWHHAAVTFNGSQRIIYLDGVSIGSDYPGTVHSVPYSNNATIGQTYPGEFFTGAMDELRIWNRALCQAEIQNNMNGELPNPTTQTGLVAYYKMDQGSAASTNTGVTTLTDASGHGNDGTLTNFALTGSTSNWVSGATTITGNVTQYAATLPSSLTESVTKTVSGSSPFTGCGMINAITPTGTTNALTGTVVSKVTNDASVNTYLGHAFIQRHYDIEPSTNPNTSTANITLYFTQADFTAYNTSRGSAPPLPIDATDAANYKANLHIMQFHGVPAGGNAPSNYPSSWTGSGPAHIILNPASVTWNSGASRWEVTVGITGFSGFFGTTSSIPLPVGLIEFATRLNNDNDVVLNWNVATPRDGREYRIERSADGSNFSQIASLRATPAAEYQYHDMQPLLGKSYYRLHIIETDNSESYSHVASVVIDSKSFVNVYPSPMKDYFIIETNDSAPSTATLYDLQGRALLQVNVKSGARINIAELPVGMYVLRIGGRTFKVVKE